MSERIMVLCQRKKETFGVPVGWQILNHRSMFNNLEYTKWECQQLCYHWPLAKS